jgi:hypothetical protein
MYRVEMLGSSRRFNNDELNNFYSSPNIIRMIKSRILSWPRHVASMAEKRNGYMFWWDTRKSPLGKP